MKNKALTLMELILAISLIGVIIAGVASFDLASRQMFRSSETKTQVTNEATLIIDRIAKDALNAIGNANTPAVTIGAGGTSMTMLLDSNHDGVYTPGTDQTVTYAFIGNQITRTPSVGLPEVLTNRATNFVVSAPVGNSVPVHIELMFNPAQAEDPFTNPRVTVETTIEVPAWSLN